MDARARLRVRTCRPGHQCLHMWRGPSRTWLARALRRWSTEAERRAWELLRNRRMLGLKFRRQHPIGPFFVDFYCPARKLVIEIDGGYHDSPGGAARAREREAYLHGLGLVVLHVRNDEVGTEVLRELILPHLSPAFPPPPRAGKQPHAGPLSATRRGGAP